MEDWIVVMDGVEYGWFLASLLSAMSGINLPPNLLQSLCIHSMKYLISRVYCIQSMIIDDLTHFLVSDHLLEIGLLAG